MHPLDPIISELRDTLDRIAESNGGYVEQTGVPPALGLLIITKLIEEEGRCIHELKISIKNGMMTKLKISDETIATRFWEDRFYADLVKKEESEKKSSHDENGAQTVAKS